LLAGRGKSMARFSRSLSDAFWPTVRPPARMRRIRRDGVEHYITLLPTTEAWGAFFEKVRWKAAYSWARSLKKKLIL